MYIFRAGILSLLLILPTTALAHTRWFATETLLPYTTTEPTALYLIIWACIAFTIVVIGIHSERIGAFSLSFLAPKKEYSFQRAAASFSMVTGAFFLLAGTHQYVFSPNLSASLGMPEWLIVVQILIGISLLVGFFERIAAVALMLLWVLVLFYTGFVAALEDVWVLSTAFFIFVMGNDYFDMFPIRALRRHVAPLQSYALPVLRWGTGMTLFVLGFSEKILHPEFGINFLSMYPWNFMQSLGLAYSDYLFTLSAGAVESLFGLVFMLGIVTRLNALVLAVFFTIPIFILGPIELAGHMPHFAAVVLLLLFGAGEHFKLVHRKSLKRS
jgi:uncharacterized membrane protein YphA (DoxX/SURF4 family)